ncbi:MAG: hypothetical protein WD876_03335 [Candidatus Pacearchaeota archaeon]
MSEYYPLFVDSVAGMHFIGKVPKEEVRAFEKRLYEATKPLIDENDEWARSSLEKAMTTVLR